MLRPAFSWKFTDDPSALLVLPFDPEEYVPTKHQYTSTRLHGVKSEKRVLFIVTFARNATAYF